MKIQQEDETEDFPPRSSFILVGGRLNTCVRKNRSRSTSNSRSSHDEQEDMTLHSKEEEEEEEEEEDVAVPERKQQEIGFTEWTTSNDDDSPISSSIVKSNMQDDDVVTVEKETREKCKTNNSTCGPLNDGGMDESSPITILDDDDFDEAMLERVNQKYKTNISMTNRTNFILFAVLLIWILTMYSFCSVLRSSMDIQKDIQKTIHEFILEKEDMKEDNECRTREIPNYHTTTLEQSSNHLHGTMWLVNPFTSSGNPIQWLSGLFILTMVSITVLDYFMDWIHRCKLSKLYNSHGQVIQVRSSWWQRGSRSTHNTILPFLPDDKYAPKESYDLVLKYLMHHQRLGQQSRKMTKHTSLLEQRKSWALVTGASRGIGRAIVISLARRDIPIVLVARDRELLERLSKLVQDCYGVQTLVIATDLCQTDAAHYVALELERNQIHVEILINNAGIGDTRELVTMSSSNIDALCQVNVTRTTQLTQILGAKMKEKRAGRIAFVSSLAGAVPGVPHAAVYAAAKAYQKSLATSLGREMEWYGIGVTCILPGAVRGTNFASRANMEDAAIWEFPFGILDPEIVSECTVNAVILGRRMVVVGWMNALLAGFLSCFLPARFIVFLCEFGWKALPFATNKKTA